MTAPAHHVFEHLAHALAAGIALSNRFAQGPSARRDHQKKTATSVAVNQMSQSTAVTSRDIKFQRKLTCTAL